jgi:hypothetical protein
VELFGTKFTLTLGMWRLRVVFMLEDGMEERPAPQRIPHHFRRTRERGTFAKG